MTAQELMQKRAALIAEAKAIAALPELNDEKRAEFDAKMKEADVLKGDIARATAVETEDAALDESAGTRAAKAYAPTAPNLNLKTKRGDTESRVRAAQFVLPTIAKVPSAMMRSEYDFWEPFVKASGFTPQA